jgi:hypothetical protein
MAWYRCIKDNQYDGVTAYRFGQYYDLQGTPPSACFTADATYASTTQKSVGAGLKVDLDGNLYVEGSTIKKAGTAVITQADADTVSTAEQAAATAAQTAAQTYTNAQFVQTNTTVNLLTADTTAEKQAKIDAVPKNASGVYTTTFQFEDGTHTETDTLLFQGFTYKIEIFGNASDASASTTKSVDIVGSANGEVIKVVDCKFADINYLDIQCTDDATSCCLCVINTTFSARYNSLHGAAKTTSNECIQIDTSQGIARDNYVANTNYGVYSIGNSNITSRDNVQDTTPPNYGLGVTTGGIIAKVATQPTGSTSNELGSGSNGAVIR